MDPWFRYWKYHDKRWGIHLQTHLHPAIYVTFIDHDLFCVMSWDKEMEWMEWNSVSKGNVKSSHWHQVIKEIKCTTYSEEAKMILIDVWQCCSLENKEIIIIICGSMISQRYVTLCKRSLVKKTIGYIIQCMWHLFITTCFIC